MAKKLLKWTLIGVVTLVLAGLAGAAAVWAVSSSRLDRVHDVGTTWSAEGFEPSVERGRHLVHAIAICSHCHGEDLGGAVPIDDAAFMKLPAPNLTPGRGGVGSRLKPQDWERAIRHGVGSDRRALLLMPSSDYAHFSGRDVADMAAYLAQLPPVDRELPARSLGPFGRLALALDPAAFMEVLRIDHAAVGTLAGASSDAAERGAWLGRTCEGCHGAGLAGRATPVAPGTPVPPNLTTHASSRVATWTNDQFVTALRTGQRPDGSMLHDFMPWRAYAQLSDEELADLWSYLRSLPPTESPSAP